MSPADQSLCARNPAVFVADLFTTSALCWNHVLTTLRELLEHPLGDTLYRILFVKRQRLFLRRARSYFEETMAFIDSRGDDLGYGTLSAQADIERADVIFSLLRRDYAIQLDNVSELSAACAEEMQWGADEATIRSAQSAVTEAGMMRTVTYMAFFFLPMSFVAAVFGTNVVELQREPYPGLRAFFAVADPITTASIVVLGYWKPILDGFPRLMWWARTTRARR